MDTVPEYPFDLLSRIRERIVKDVDANGRTYRCSSELSTAFAGWSHEQIDEWAIEHGLVIIAQPDRRIVIMRVTPDSLAPLIAIVGKTEALELQQFARERVRAEVDAMDWSDIIE
ncbi:MAG TPA: hypothetical protein VL866_24240 [Pyrinomonadaceae bacterium]|nr:hypothetical protein [Pyrinomonadaceae bacterium]